MIGIDPGLRGAIAWYRIEPDGTERVTIWDMPLIAHGQKNEVHAHELACILSEVPLEVPVFVEEVSSMPRDGVVSAFRFGTSYGIVLGVAGSQHRKIYRVRPNVWKTLLGLSSDKKASVKLAHHTFPNANFDHDGQAEAALLAKLGHDKFTMVQSARAGGKPGAETGDEE